jgi:AcrR family transcriptional regulator
MTEVKSRKSRGTVRRVAGRQEILAATNSIGLSLGWKAVTIRAVAQRLGYTAPLLYQHFRDKQELLTELALEGQLALASELGRELPSDPHAAILRMVDRYWSFMLENKQLYRLMNGMDGVAIDLERIADIAPRSFAAATSVVQAWLVGGCGEGSGAERLMDELWTVLHGMAVLHLDRHAPFDLGRAKDCVAKLLMGTREQAQGLRKSTEPTAIPVARFPSK